MDTFLQIIIIALPICLVIWGIWYNSPEQKGKRGEKRVHNILMQLSDDYYVWHDVIMKTDNGTTQIDHIVVSKYGVFVIETKNYRGEIYGNDDRQEWTQMIVTDVQYKRSPKTYTYVTKNHLYNPVKQSMGHVYSLKKCLSEWPHLKFVPIVVFVGKADISKVESKYHVIYDDNLLSIIESYKTIYLSDDDVRNVVKHINDSNARLEIKDREHVRNIRKTAREVNGKIASGICPQCGGTLVQRKGKYGYFYGCSNYPICKFTA